MNGSLYKIDRYPYKNLHHLKIFHEWSAQYTHKTNSNAVPWQISNEILPVQSFCNSRRTLPIYTNASKNNDHSSTAFYLPHNPEIPGQFNISKKTSVYMTELSALYLSLQSSRRLEIILTRVRIGHTRPVSYTHLTLPTIYSV